MSNQNTPVLSRIRREITVLQALLLSSPAKPLGRHPLLLEVVNVLVGFSLLAVLWSDVSSNAMNAGLAFSLLLLLAAFFSYNLLLLAAFFSYNLTRIFKVAHFQVVLRPKIREMQHIVESYSCHLKNELLEDEVTLSNDFLRITDELMQMDRLPRKLETNLIENIFLNLVHLYRPFVVNNGDSQGGSCN